MEHSKVKYSAFFWNITYTITCVVFLLSCSKNQDSPDPVDNTDNGNTDSSITYNFSTPQFVSSINYGASAGNGNFAQKMCVKENNITIAPYTAYYNPGNNGTYTISSTWSYQKNGSFSQKGFSIAGPKGNHFPYIPCFDLDQTGSTLFVVIDKILYKCDLNSGIQLKIAQDIGNATALKAISQNEVILSTDLQNGALLKIKDDGTQQLIASNLINPGVCDIYNNDYYVVEKNPAGSVKKIAQGGGVTNILTNVNVPLNICFDKNGNFVLQTQWTKEGGTYLVYTLYTASGQKISDVTDDLNDLIVTGVNLFMPMFIDNDNNLFFSHNNLVGGNGITYCNPNSSQTGVWEMQMIKQ